MMMMVIMVMVVRSLDRYRTGLSIPPIHPQQLACGPMQRRVETHWTPEMRSQWLGHPCYRMWFVLELCPGLCVRP